MTTLTKIQSKLTTLSELIPKDTNVGSVLGQLFLFQEAKRWSEYNLKKSWQAATDNNLIPTDDELRGLDGVHSILHSRNFVVSVKVDNPRLLFSRETFISAVARKFKLKEEVLQAIAKDCVEDSVKPLRKTVLEIIENNKKVVAAKGIVSTAA